MDDALFSCTDLVKRYGASTVVNHLSFAIRPGECLGVIGPTAPARPPPSACAWA
jgi:lipooligosaccharide transport system ATP-binding protein